MVEKNQNWNYNILYFSGDAQIFINYFETKLFIAGSINNNHTQTV